ncbi:uncharacterized protein LOC129615622 [Condylostylus longicornis]|uniref:uncharacterized protein LOC129615622 n=1 Tax=Condylostylus longicornis TaxID=2530218 RepID=UPI00244E0E8D|nr:uncharacterized protein LOC129615622 [Condylostylus longicornis]
MVYFKFSFVALLALICIIPAMRAEDYMEVKEDEFKELGLENWNKARIYHFFFFLNTNPCNALYTTLGIADAQCTLRCLSVGSQLGGVCRNNECECNVFPTQDPSKK